MTITIPIWLVTLSNILGAALIAFLALVGLVTCVAVVYFYKNGLIGK